MGGIYIRKGIVTEIYIIFGLFAYKTRGSCMYNKTAEKQGSFNSFIVHTTTPCFISK